MCAAGARALCVRSPGAATSGRNASCTDGCTPSAATSAVVPAQRRCNTHALYLVEVQKTVWARAVLDLPFAQLQTDTALASISPSRLADIDATAGCRAGGSRRLSTRGAWPACPAWLCRHDWQSAACSCYAPLAGIQRTTLGCAGSPTWKAENIPSRLPGTMYTDCAHSTSATYPPNDRPV